MIHKIMEGCWLGQLNPSRIDTDFLGSSAGKESACNAGDSSSFPGLGRSPGGGHATHSNILAWKIPWTKEPSRLQSMGSQRVGHD